MPWGSGQGTATLGNGDSASAGVLLTVRDVAERLSVSPDWVYRRIGVGELGHVRFGGNAIRVPGDALEAFLRRAPGLRTASPPPATASSPAPAARRRAR